MPDPAATLARAADLIDELGWHQGDYRGARGEVCGLAAVQLAAEVLPGSSVPPTPDTAYCAAAKLLSARLGRTVPDAVEAIAKIVAWNDEPGRTREQVTAALRGGT